MSSEPSSPVKVSASAANYTPATIDPELRSNINALLLREGHVTKIQDHLLHTLNSNNANWPTAVQNHALNLLRSGEVTTFPALLRRVLDDVREDTLSSAPGASSNSKSNANGDPGTPSSSTSTSKKGANGTSADSRHSLAVPETVVAEALKVTRECLDSIVFVEE